MVLPGSNNHVLKIVMSNNYLTSSQWFLDTERVLYSWPRFFLSSRKKIRQENIQFLSSTNKIFKQDHAHISWKLHNLLTRSTLNDCLSPELLFSVRKPKKNSRQRFSSEKADKLFRSKCLLLANNSCKDHLDQQQQEKRPPDLCVRIRIST